MENNEIINVQMTKEVFETLGSGGNGEALQKPIELPVLVESIEEGDPTTLTYIRMSKSDMELIRTTTIPFSFKFTYKGNEVEMVVTSQLVIPDLGGRYFIGGIYNMHDNTGNKIEGIPFTALTIFTYGIQAFGLM